ncbi:ABC transporter substrate-binding protein [Afipia sp. P52-10]|jgi:NitT/TauT family transport system substrate-binding protein|uniref:ABC transporter substrate-binding protein n=1 Tax=Afipia sp. P52-10 TaxID=1429916 RepID=UPI0003DF01C4|nr:ABC transporter substrate-binding protein [Afipia sp. P52-10]ETR76544.1 ABC transporter substrate-binding protein [Afipia sp. P52-10]
MRLKTIAAAMMTLLAAGAAHGQQKIQIGCTATTDCSAAMVAVDEGIFKRLGLDAEMVLIGINSNIPAALLSNSIQIGGPTSSVFLQAVDGGLDLVAVSGASVMNQRTANLTTAFARNGVTIKEPKDFVGKKVGAPGLGAFLHVLFVKWLQEKGVDPKGVNFVEVSFPTMNDILKSGAVDAVLTSEPFVTRMTNAGTGYVAARYVADLNRTEPIIFYAASRDWAEKNPEIVKKFREAVAEGAKIVNADRDKASASIAKFTKQPLDIVKLNPPSYQEPAMKASDLAWWVEVMKQQKLLQGNIDLAKVVLK